MQIPKEEAVFFSTDGGDTRRIVRGEKVKIKLIDGDVIEGDVREIYPNCFYLQIGPANGRTIYPNDGKLV